MDAKYNGAEVYFKGDKVILSGDTNTVYGGVFCVGTFAEGLHSGESVLIAQDYADVYMVKTSGEIQS